MIPQPLFIPALVPPWISFHLHTCAVNRHQDLFVDGAVNHDIKFHLRRPLKKHVTLNSATKGGMSAEHCEDQTMYPDLPSRGPESMTETAVVVESASQLVVKNPRHFLGAGRAC